MTVSKQTRREARGLLEGAGDGPFWCLCCEDECELTVVDEGIGAYEYWGATGVDVRLGLVSECCESGYANDDPKIKGYNDRIREQIEADQRMDQYAKDEGWA